MKDIKKIGILTLHRANNYGAVLQTYALSKFLRDRGYEPFVVNYVMEKPSAREYMARPFSFLSKIFEKKVISWKFIKSKFSGQKGKSREMEFATIFQDFRDTHLNIRGETCVYEDLMSNPPEAYAYIVGSDQVWAADFVFSSPAYLLGFVPKNSRRISYAASFGKAKLERYLQRVFHEQVSQFHAVSVREQSGVDLVNNLIGIKATHVVDPTLLLTDYSEIIDYSLVPDEDYILSYRLGQSEDLNNWMNIAIDEFVATKGQRHFLVSTNAPVDANMPGEILKPTPGQLLGLIEKASFFVTNSFHGTIFAFLLRTDFLTFARDSATDKQNLRLTELLEALVLAERYCDPMLDVAEILTKAVKPCNFDAAEAALSTRRVDSAMFLSNALEQQV